MHAERFAQSSRNGDGFECVHIDASRRDLRDAYDRFAMLHGVSAGHRRFAEIHDVNFDIQSVAESGWCFVVTFDAHRWPSDAVFVQHGFIRLVCCFEKIFETSMRVIQIAWEVDDAGVVHIVEANFQLSFERHEPEAASVMQTPKLNSGAPSVPALVHVCSAAQSGAASSQPFSQVFGAVELAVTQSNPAPQSP